MTVYKTRKGIVLSEICGEYVLVAAKKLQDICPYVSQVNETSAFIWKQLEEGKNLRQIVQAVENEYDSGDSIDIQSAVEAFIRQMLELNYLTISETGKEDEKEI